MKGKIVSYDPVNGIGKIIIKNEGVKLFSIDNWIDYDNTPSVGMEVECGIENNKLIDITSVDSSKSLLNELKKEFDAIPLPDLKIKGNVAIEECLEGLFGKYKKTALKYKDVLEKNKSIPYKKVKRFIKTAYNNLLEIDQKINDKHLVEIRDSLYDIEYFYDDLSKIIKSPIYVNLEKFVLNKQQNYSVMKKRFETNKELSVESIKKANLLELEIQNLKEDINKLNPKSKEYKEILEIIKSKKRKYVDLIDTAQNLKEENSLIVNDITEFEKVYEELFKNFFEKESKILKQILEKEMNILAYQFDTIVWENAKKSKSVQKFFEESKIEGSYSTKTFMKYYLKTLNTDKMNEKNQQLLEAMDELTLFSKSIIIYDKNLNRARELSMLIENLDHDSNVKIISSLKNLVLYIKENDSKIDIAVLEVDKSSIQSIEKIMFILKKLGINFLLFSEDITNRKDIVYIDHKNMNSLKKEIKNIL